MNFHFSQGKICIAQLKESNFVSGIFTSQIVPAWRDVLLWKEGCKNRHILLDQLIFYNLSYAELFNKLKRNKRLHIPTPTKSGLTAFISYFLFITYVVHHKMATYHCCSKSKDKNQVKLANRRVCSSYPRLLLTYHQPRADLTPVSLQIVVLIYVTHRLFPQWLIGIKRA